MNVGAWDEALRQVTSVAGVRGALIISDEDGLVVAEAAMDDLATADVAALAASLVARAARCAAAAQSAPLEGLHLVCESGALFAVAGPTPLWLVAVATPDVELGRLRLVLRDFASALH